VYHQGNLPTGCPQPHFSDLSVSVTPPVEC